MGNKQNFKFQGKIDENGKLIITDSIDIPSGDVEVIILPKIISNPDLESLLKDNSIAKVKFPYHTQIKAFQELFDNPKPVSSDFDTEEARWEALKEKYNL